MGTVKGEGRAPAFVIRRINVRFQVETFAFIKNIDIARIVNYS